MKHWIWPVGAVLSLSCASAPPKKPPASQALSTRCASDARASDAGPFTPDSITVLVRGPDGKPAAGTTVRFRQRSEDLASGVTDATGHYQGVLTPGMYTVQVEADGRALAAEGVLLEKGCAVSLTLSRP